MFNGRKILKGIGYFFAALLLLLLAAFAYLARVSKVDPPAKSGILYNKK